MTKDVFFDQLKKYSINLDLVAINNQTAEGYCIRKTYSGWEVFVRERGKEYDIRLFSTESEAFSYMLNELLALYKSTSDVQAPYLDYKKDASL